MLNKLLLIAFLLFLSSITFGQVCGGGTRTVKVYTLNGLQAKNLKYKYFSLTPNGLHYDARKSIKFIENSLFPTKQNKTYANFTTSTIIPTDVAESFLKTYRAKDFYNSMRYKDKGVFDKGIVKNRVSEMYLYIFLMKISSDNYPSVYIAGPLFGLCSRTENILLEKDNVELKLERW